MKQALFISLIYTRQIIAKKKKQIKTAIAYYYKNNKFIWEYLKHLFINSQFFLQFYLPNLLDFYQSDLATSLVVNTNELFVYKIKCIFGLEGLRWGMIVRSIE